MLAFIHRNPNEKEVEKLRLVLSTYQDGTGMLLAEAGKTLPGWRDFERSVAVVFGGRSLETKFIFDVLFPDPDRPGISFGLSCKMRRELDRIERTGRVLIEISNASGEFSDYLRQHGVDLAHYREYASQVGPAVNRLIEQWHSEGQRSRRWNYRYLAQFLSRSIVESGRLVSASSISTASLKS